MMWNEIKGYEGVYEVNTMGKVRSIPRRFITKSKKIHVVKELIRVPSINHRGYERLQLTNIFGEKKIYSVHRLVAQTFIPNPENKPEVNHKNAIKTDNRVENLEWVTKKENEHHCSVNGLRPRGENSHYAKIKERDVIEIRQMLTAKVKYKDIAKKFGITTHTIAAINNKTIWAHVK